jgi:hypothetical protein
MPRFAIHVFIVAVIIALTALAVWLDWGPVVHSAGCLRLV